MPVTLTLTFDVIMVMTPKTIGVLLIWYITHKQNFKVLRWKVLSQHKGSVDRGTDGRMNGLTDRQMMWLLHTFQSGALTSSMECATNMKASQQTTIKWKNTAIRTKNRQNGVVVGVAQRLCSNLHTNISCWYLTESSSWDDSKENQ